MTRALALLLLVAACGDDSVRVDITRGDEILLSVEADVADTADERERGLRGAPPLGPSDGLLIVMPRQLEVCIVNDGVDQAIDAVFAADDGRVAAVERQIPAGDARARCHDARRILEVAATSADAVESGDKMIVTK